MNSEEKIDYKKMLFKFERSLSRKSLKDLAKECCALDEIISTQEGQDKKRIITKYVPAHRVAKFNEYISLFSKMKKQLPNFYALLSRISDIEMGVQIIINSLKEQGSFIFEYNRLIREVPVAKETIKRLTGRTTRHTKIKFNEDNKRFYMFPVDVWEQIVKLRDKFVTNEQEGKILCIALDEFIERNPIAEEFIPSEVKSCIEIIKNPPMDIRIDKAFIEQWLRDIEKVETEEDLAEWSSKPYKAKGANIFPTYKEIEPQEERLTAFTGSYNIFEIN